MLPTSKPNILKFIKVTWSGYYPVYCKDGEETSVIEENEINMQEQSVMLGFEEVPSEHFGNNNSFFEPDMLPYARHGCSHLTIEEILNKDKGNGGD